MSPFEKREALKTLETHCYRICFYLLNEEKTACEAAKRALIQLYGDDALWTMNEQLRENRIRKISSFHALAVREGVSRFRT
ncbi:MULTISPECIES: hypothetical protein [Cohnella]|uniref:hypothetical protein n=1 Tax=Cohnella TaxID=329857 RepID=UPI0009BA6FE8|nr:MULTISPECIES: hypothetical protein [Cohnella]MBN2980890.1 hypothetical protein [Cohnella algarum]